MGSTASGAIGALPEIFPEMLSVVSNGMLQRGGGGTDPRCFLWSPGVTTRVFSADTGRMLRCRGDSIGVWCYLCSSRHSFSGSGPLGCGDGGRLDRSQCSWGSRWGLWLTRGSLVATKALPTRESGPGEGTWGAPGPPGCARTGSAPCTGDAGES